MTWLERRAAHLAKLEQATALLREVLADDRIWFRVRQTTTRSLEQLEVAQTQLQEQDIPL